MATKSNPFQQLQELNKSVNRGVLFMVHVSMAMTVMAYLAFTWSTVVLLGGYVTSLEKKDFWCLTLISLLEATWIFNDMESDTKLMMSLLMFMKDLIPTAIDITKACLPTSANSGNMAFYLFRKMATVLYTGIIMAPVMVVIFSILILVVLSPVLFVALSVWRLHQHDYGVIGGDSSKASLAPALYIFYSLVLVQGVLSIFSSASGPTQALGLVRFYEQCKFEKKWGLYAILEYIEDTMEKCKKDLVSVQDASLLSRASELLDSESWDNFLTGVRVLGTFSQVGMEDSRATILLSRQKIQKLILTLGLTQSSINEWLTQRSKDKMKNLRLPELREHAARIVAGFADGIHLAQFPGAARCLSTLLETTDDEDSIELIVPGLKILEKLAPDNHNCREICSMPSLLPKIMAPICSADLIQDQDTRIARSSTVKGTFKVLRGLTSVPGKAGRRLRREICNNKQAIANLESIIILDHGNEDGHELQMLAMEILLELTKDKSINLNGETIPNVIKKQVQIFLADKGGEEAAAAMYKDVAGKALSELSSNSESNSTIIIRAPIHTVGRLTEKLDAKNNISHSAAMYKDVAGKALSELSSNSESNSTIIIRAPIHTVGRLTEKLDAKNKISHRIFAAEILRNLCKHCRLGKECLNEILLPKVLLEVGLTSNRGRQIAASSAQEDDEESQNTKERREPVSFKQIVRKVTEGISGHDEGKEEPLGVKKLQETLLSLTLQLYDLVGADNFALVVQQKSPGDCTFVANLKTIVKKNCEPKLSSLKIVKHCCQIAISMLQRNQYTADFRKLNFVESVSNASEKLSDVESCRFITETTGLKKKSLRPLLSELENILKQELDRAVLESVTRSRSGLV